MAEPTPMPPAEFDAVCRLIWRQFPDLSESSGYRSQLKNVQVGSSDASKHRLGMGRDFYVADMNIRLSILERARDFARSLGLWTELEIYPNAEWLDHLHVQGLAPGPVPDWWLDKYGI